LKKKTGVPVQNRDFDGDTAVGLYGQDVSSAEPTPRPTIDGTTRTSQPTTPVESISRNPWSLSGGLQTEEDPLMQSIESKVRGNS
jgi:hypothetical protein